MLERIIDNTKLLQLDKLFKESNNIVITCHMSPDGDAVGGATGLCLLLRKLGKIANVITPDQAPYDLAFIPDYKNMTAYSRHPVKARRLISEADLIVCLDYNGLNRIAQMEAPLRNARCRKVMIDHHLHPDEFCDVTISYPVMTSTCELLYRILDQLGYTHLIDTTIAECIYTGMMTDTGNFSYNSNHAELYIIVAELVKKGVDKDRIYKLAINTSSENRMRLTGYALAEKMIIYPEHKASLIVLTQDDLTRFNYQSGDTETLANRPLAIPEVVWSTFFRQEKGYVKVSMRSEGSFAVNILCTRYFNGGGHANASGGEFHGSMEEAVKTYHKMLDDLSKVDNNPINLQSNEN